MDKNMHSMFLSLYCMVLADGVADARELETLYHIGKDYYGITPEELTREVMSGGTSFPEYVTLKDKVTFLYHMVEIAWADGEIQDEERELLKKYTLRQGFAPENVNQIVDYLLEKVHDKVSLDDVLKEIATE